MLLYSNFYDKLFLFALYSGETGLMAICQPEQLDKTWLRTSLWMRPKYGLGQQNELNTAHSIF